ncbi:uncharacterized protein A4U43_C04F22930, partial [Asparagus officinalis]
MDLERTASTDGLGGNRDFGSISSRCLLWLLAATAGREREEVLKGAKRGAG